MKKQLIISCLSAFLILTSCAFAQPAGDPTLTEKESHTSLAPQIGEETSEMHIPDQTTVLMLALSSENLHLHETALATLQKMTAEVRIRLDLMPTEALGTEKEILEDMISGENTIQCMLLGTETLAELVPELSVSAEPFRFQTFEDAHAFMDSEEERSAEQKLGKYGLRVLGRTDNAFYVLTNSRLHVTEPGDLNGLRIRISGEDKGMAVYLEAMGAIPSFVPDSELATALQMKSLDGQENSLYTIRNEKLYLYQPYLSVTNHRYSGLLMIIRESALNSLTDQQYSTLTEAASSFEKQDREAMQLLNEEMLAALEAVGMTITYPELSAFRETDS